LLRLGGHSKQAGDEGDLPGDISFAHPSDLSLANHVHDLVALERSPCRFQRKEAHPRLDQPFDEAVVRVLAIWDIRSEKPEMCATKSRTDKPLLKAYTHGYVGNQAEIGRLLFVGEGKYQHGGSS
jgi:hypothetical protein